MVRNDDRSRLFGYLSARLRHVRALLVRHDRVVAKLLELFNVVLHLRARF